MAAEPKNDIYHIEFSIFDEIAAYSAEERCMRYKAIACCVAQAKTGGLIVQHKPAPTVHIPI